MKVAEITIFDRTSVLGAQFAVTVARWGPDGSAKPLGTPTRLDRGMAEAVSS